MSVAQIIFRTVITTIDLLLAFAVIAVKEMSDTSKRRFTVFVMLNLLGVWI